MEDELEEEEEEEEEEDEEEETMGANPKVLKAHAESTYRTRLW